MARSWECEPKMRSTPDAVHLIFPVSRSRPSYTWSVEDTLHSVSMSSRFTKKSLVSVSRRPVKTPCSTRAMLAPGTRRPPRKMSDSALRPIDELRDSIKTPIVVFDAAIHL